MHNIPINIKVGNRLQKLHIFFNVFKNMYFAKFTQEQNDKNAVNILKRLWWLFWEYHLKPHLKEILNTFV